MLIQILVDNPKSWIVPYARGLVDLIKNEFSYSVRLIHQHQDVVQGEVLCLLSCERLFENLELNKHNLVVHESNLPKGKGWSPLTWQVLEGASKIPVTLFEASSKVDAGPIYIKDYIYLKGNELLPEIKKMQGELTNQLILRFLRKYPKVRGKEQIGEESFYSKRTTEHSELDINKTLKEQFNLLRVCDNERYPAFFYMNGEKYILNIYKA